MRGGAAGARVAVPNGFQYNPWNQNTLISKENLEELIKKYNPDNESEAGILPRQKYSTRDGSELGEEARKNQVQEQMKIWRAALAYRTLDVRPAD